MHTIQQFYPAKLHEGKTWFISYYAYNPLSKKLERKRIKINRIKSVSERRKYSKEIINTINVKLYSGWNPFIDPDAKKSYTKFSEALNHFWKIAEKKLSEDTIREDTYRDYVSYPKNFKKWLDETKKGDIYIFELDRKLIIEFLNHIHIERNNSAITRNNYLAFFRIFATFLIDNDYIKHKFTEGIASLKKGKKKRKQIEPEHLESLRTYLYKKNKYYLLACEIEYYLFIRPIELSKIKISDIDFIKGTIKIDETISKNRKTALVTMPLRLVKLIDELNIKEIDPDFYLFSENFRPGKKFKSDKCFRDYWLRNIRKDLNFPDSYQFYSLKDTGIRHMIKQVGDVVSVRDQARHSSISITNIYTDGELLKANDSIKRLDY